MVKRVRAYKRTIICVVVLVAIVVLCRNFYSTVLTAPNVSAVQSNIQFFVGFTQYRAGQYAESVAALQYAQVTPVVATVYINNHQDQEAALFNAYEIDGELFFAINDISSALEKTQASINWHNRYHLEFLFHVINDRTYARIQDILTLSPWESTLTEAYGATIEINTNEPYASEYTRHIIEDFMLANYRHIFTRETVWKEMEEYGGAILEISVDGRFSFMYYHGDMPAILVWYSPAGSQGNHFVYFFIDGKYRYVGQMPINVDDKGRIVKFTIENEDRQAWQSILVDGEMQWIALDEEVTLVQNYFWNSLPYEIADTINQRLWQTTTLPCGAVVDVNLPCNIIELVLKFFAEKVAGPWVGWASDLVVNEIKFSLIDENLIRVKTTHNVNFYNYHWLELYNTGGAWVIDRYTTSWMWYEDIQRRKTNGI